MQRDARERAEQVDVLRRRLEPVVRAEPRRARHTRARDALERRVRPRAAVRCRAMLRRVLLLLLLEVERRRLVHLPEVHCVDPV